MNIIKNVFCTTLFIAASTFSFNAIAEEDELTPYYGQCLENGDPIEWQATFGKCTADALAYWDKELNQNYKHLMKVAPTEDAKAQFKTAQRQWIKNRDEMVKAYAKDFGGQGERLAATLEVKLTRDQANYLQEYAEIFENAEE